MRTAGHGAAVFFHHLLDRQRYLVAVHYLAPGGDPLGDPDGPSACYDPLSCHRSNVFSGRYGDRA